MSHSHHHSKFNKLHLFSSSSSDDPSIRKKIITLEIGEIYENDVKITLPTSHGEAGHYLQADGLCGDYYHPIDGNLADDRFLSKDGLTSISNEILTTKNIIYHNDNSVKSYKLARQMVTFVKGIVEINNSIAILYCNSLGQLMLIKNNVEYLIANESNTMWSTIIVGSAGNLMIGHVFKGNLYHHYYLKGKFYDVPIDMTNDNERFIAHLNKDGYPCYIYTRYGEIDQVTISYSLNINGENEWYTNVIHTRPSVVGGGYFRSYNLLNTHDGILYLAESCKEKYFSISSCTDITKDDWKKDIVYEDGFDDYQIRNDGQNFIVNNNIYQLNIGWQPLSIKGQILDVANQTILTTDGYLISNNKSILIDPNIIYGSLLSLPNGEIMVLVVNDVESIQIYRMSFNEYHQPKLDVVLI